MRKLAASLVLAVTLGAASIADAAPRVRFTKLTSPVYRGNNATATVSTTRGASCSITVNYRSGRSSAKGLARKTASSNGVASWTWKVGTNTTPGRASVRVACTKSGSTGSATKYFEVRRR